MVELGSVRAPVRTIERKFLMNQKKADTPMIALSDSRSYHKCALKQSISSSVTTILR